MPNHTSMIGPKTAPTPAVPRRWKEKSAIRITTVIGTTKGSKNGRRHFQPLDGAEDRDRRRETPSPYSSAAPNSPRATRTAAAGAAVAPSDGPAPSAPGCPLHRVVGAQDVDVVLEGDHDDERPEDQGQHPENVGRRDGHGVRPEEALANGVERAGADVAVDHAEGGQTEDGERRPRRALVG